MLRTTAVIVWLAVVSIGARLGGALKGRRGGEGGSSTLETVVIAAGLLAAAIGLVVVIRAAVDSHAGSIQ
jgi:hypothetical protein